MCAKADNSSAKKSIRNFQEFLKKFKYKPFPRQKEFHDSDAKYRLFGGAAGPGKTKALLYEAIHQAHKHPGVDTLLLRRTFPELEASLITYFRRDVPRELYEKYNEAKHTVSWLNGSTSLGQSNVDSNGIATIVTTLGPGGNQLITANYKGTSQSTGTLALHVAGFSFTVSTPAVSVTPGQSVQVAVNGSAYYGFSGPVDLTCSGMPSPGSCALSASVVNFNNGTKSQNLTLTVGTATVSAAQAAQVASPLLRGLALATLFPLFGLVGIRSTRVRGALMVLLLTVGAIFTLGLSGCGGAPGSTTTSSPTSPTTSDVAPGTYTVTVVAQSGVNTVQVPVTVTVQ